MPIGRTPKGTAASNRAGETLERRNVTIQQGARIVVGVAYPTGVGEPVVSWGPNELVSDRAVAGNGLACRIFSYYHTGALRTFHVTATWESNPGSRAMFVTEYTNANTLQHTAAQAEANTSDPNTGTRNAETYDEVYVGALASQGPVNDSPGTPQGDYESGQRAGTIGAPPVSNVTIHELFEIPEEPFTTEAAKTGATSRDWCSVLAIYHVGDSAPARDSKYMRELWRDLQDTVALVEGHGFEVAIENQEGLISVTDISTLRLRKRALP